MAMPRHTIWDTPTFIVGSIGPNPGYAGQSLRLDLPANTYNAQIHLVTTSGQIWSLPFADGVQQITLAVQLPSGMYYLRVQYNTSSKTIPLVIIGK
jgi:hypothetical protein